MEIIKKIDTNVDNLLSAGKSVVLSVFENKTDINRGD